MSERTEAVNDCIREHMKRHGRAPTVREIARAVGASSTSVVDYHLRRLERDGEVTRVFGMARGIEPAGAVTAFVGDEVVVEIDGEQVRATLVGPAPRAERVA